METDALIIGGGPLALLLALKLHKKGMKVSLAGESVPGNPPINPEMMLVGGDDTLPPLFQHSLAQWRGIADELGLPPLLTTSPALDLATSQGRVTKLRQEATLDALGGEPVSFIESPPEEAPRALGAKMWEEAPVLLPNTVQMLQLAVANAGIERRLINPAALSIVDLSHPQLTLQTGEVLQARHIIFTSARALRRVLPPLGLALPLRPARGHVLVLQTPQPHGLPLMLQRLHRGHIFIVPVSSKRVDIHYDAINDPAQSTLNMRTSQSLINALYQHVEFMIPSLSGAEVLGTTVSRFWLTPDFLPALGPWPGLPGVYVGVGWGGRGTALAAGAADILSQLVLTGETGVNIQSMAPNRFANGLWQVVKQPGSLTWQEPSIEIDTSLMSIKPEYMENVNLVEAPKPQYATKVNQVEKTVVESAGRRAAPTMQAKSKPKVTTAPVK